MCPSWKEREKVKKGSTLGKDPCSPFYKTRGGGYIDVTAQVRGEKKRESVHLAKKEYGENFVPWHGSRCPWSLRTA
jgi:hypothetical protein